jgi:D-sedoheptulose 7-phosphate isomerase
LLKQIDTQALAHVLDELCAVRARAGRLFVLGVGGSAANASHAVNDFRKIARIEAYAPTDNVAEITARTNDDGWATTLVEWLRVSRLRADDLVLVFSVGGGDVARGVSPNLVEALRLASEVGARIIGVVGRDGGYTARVAHACVRIPTIDERLVTPFAEAMRAVVWHLLVSDPRLRGDFA